MSRRRHKHEEHVNHEAWAIPYGDLLTLLLAFFVVMYAISSVNQGKYRVLSDSLQAAFRGDPKALAPIQVGQRPQAANTQEKATENHEMIAAKPTQMADNVHVQPDLDRAGVQDDAAEQALETVAGEVERAMSELIDDGSVIVHRHGQWVEVEIRTDLLFASGLARLSGSATQVLQRMADSVKPFPNPIRVEGHTDNLPVRNGAFQSNWELSAARAATVVHLFTDRGIDPKRLSVIGLGEYRPLQPNTTAAGRSANRRVVLVILSGGPAAAAYAQQQAQSVLPVAAPAAAPSAAPP
jgi:chemotaxis protein MotB